MGRVTSGIRILFRDLRVGATLIILVVGGVSAVFAQRWLIVVFCVIGVGVFVANGRLICRRCRVCDGPGQRHTDDAGNDSLHVTRPYHACARAVSNLTNEM